MQGPFSMSWQARCGLDDSAKRADAEAYWLANGFSSRHFSWDDENTLTVANTTTGFTPPQGAAVGAPFPGGHSEFTTTAELASSMGGDVAGITSSAQRGRDNAGGDWFNIVMNLPPGMVKAADGSDIPAELIRMHGLEAWHKNYAVKLRAGDLLMLDNLRVQHGRLPFANGDGAKRKMVTLLYE